MNEIVQDILVKKLNVLLCTFKIFFLSSFRLFLKFILCDCEPLTKSLCLTGLGGLRRLTIPTFLPSVLGS